MARSAVLAALVAVLPGALGQDCTRPGATCPSAPSTDELNMLQLQQHPSKQQQAARPPPANETQQPADRPARLGSMPFTGSRDLGGEQKGKIRINEDGVLNEYWLPGATTIDDFTTVKFEPPYRFYLMKEHTTDWSDDSKYYKPPLIGKTFAVDMYFGPDGAACGCNLNFYLVDMPVEDPGKDNDHYCDAQCFEGLGCCAEFDMNEGNMMAQQITNHACTNDYTGHPDWQCHKWGDPEAKTSPSEFGPGGHIDSSKEFTYAQEFNVNAGHLEIVTKIIQDGKVLVKRLGPSSQMDAMWGNIDKGMAFVTGYWYDEHMNWLDSDACGNGKEHCTMRPAYLKNWRITSNGDGGVGTDPATDPSPAPSPAESKTCRWGSCSGHELGDWCRDSADNCRQCDAHWC